MTTLGSVPIAEYATPSTKELPEAVRKYVKVHDGMLLANHGALTLGTDLFAAYYKMETIEHFAHISLVARLLGGERLLSRQEVERLQGLRGMYGIASPAPICPPALSHVEGPEESALGDPADCQTVFAPESDGARLISGLRGAARQDGEIRLTYRELTALIEAAVREIK